MPAADSDDLDIRFCDRCAQSIPDGEFEQGRAITVDGRHLHLGCAVGRSLGIGGPRSWFTFVLALYAAGIATFLLVGALKGGPDPNVVPAAVEARIEAARVAALDAAREDHVDLLTQFAAGLAARRAEDAADAGATLQQHVDLLMTRLGEYERAEADNSRALVARLDRQKAELKDLEKVFADALRRAEAEVARAGRIQAAEAERVASEPEEPEAAPPAPPVTPPPGPDTPPPDHDPERDAQVARWITRLTDQNEDIRFSATVELSRLGDARAAPALLTVLQRDNDPLVLMGAATALGSIRWADAVSALIEALDHQEVDVRTAAREALHSTTEHVIEVDPKAGARLQMKHWRTLQKNWRGWWEANETAVRQRLGQ